MTPHPTTPPPCLSDLEIADLIVGRLQGEDRARALRHVAECESCYEVYAEAQALLTIEGGEQDGEDGEPDGETPPAAAAQAALPEAEVGLPEPLPFRSRAMNLQWVMAIAAGLTVGIALALLMPGRDVSSPAGTAEWPTFDPRPSAAVGSGGIPPIPGDRVRGTDAFTGPTVADFFLGVDWAHLEEAWARRDAAAMAKAAGNVRVLLKGRSPDVEISGSLHRELVDRMERLQKAPAAVEDPSDLTPRLSREMGLLGYEFALGRFAEAGRLAALAGRREFFAPGSPASRYLETMQSWDASQPAPAEKLEDLARDGLDAVAASWPADPGAAEEPLSPVAEAFASLILAYDGAGRD